MVIILQQSPLSSSSNHHDPPPPTAHSEWGRKNRCRKILGSMECWMWVWPKLFHTIVGEIDEVAKVCEG
jgi:hypothetical protein